MELSGACWNSNLVIGDTNISHQWDLSSIDQLITTKTICEDAQNYYSPSSKCYPHSFTPNTVSGSAINYYTHTEKPKKLAKIDSPGSLGSSEDMKTTISGPRGRAFSPTILSFGCPDSPSDQSQVYESIVRVVKTEEELKTLNSNGAKRSYETMVAQGAKKRPPSHNQEHVIAERMRREKITQKFIALSAVVPGLKKMDKASVLGDAVEYMKKLQEKVQILEEQAAKRVLDSAVMVKKSQLLANDDGNYSCDENFDYENLPDIEVRLSGKSLLIKIHCGNHKGVLVKALSEIEDLHLTVTNTSAVPFASSSLDITVMAQIEEKFSMTVKDLVKKLSSAVKDFICRN